jgi:hypothetical protein
MTTGKFDMTIAQYNHAMHERDFAGAVRIIRPLAEQGDARWQCALGAHYGGGWGIEQDVSLALYWHQKSADQGHPNGKYHLGTMLLYADGVPQDYKRGLALLEEAAGDGLIEAAYALGMLYRGGGIAAYTQDAQQRALRDGEVDVAVRRIDPAVMPPDFERAFAWLRQAADKGMPDAEFAVGEAYAEGEGVPINHFLAFQWFVKAADQGFVEAAIAIATAYSQGKGVKRDRKRAHRWLKWAAKQGYPDAIQALNERPAR